MVIALLQRVIHRLLQLHLHVARDFTHPEHHPGKDHHRNHGDDTLKQLLLFLRELPGGFVDEDTEAQTECCGKEYPDPHDANPASALGSLQITGDEAHDKGSFKPFT